MPEVAPTSIPPLVCCRCFEPGHLQDQLLSEAYGHLVVVSGPAQTRTAQTPASRRKGRRDGQASPLNPTCGGMCA
jgi:hypothetical protein